MKLYVISSKTMLSKLSQVRMQLCKGSFNTVISLSSYIHQEILYHFWKIISPGCAQYEVNINVDILFVMLRISKLTKMIN